MTTIVSLNQRQPGQVKATSKLKAMMSIAVMIVFLNITTLNPKLLIEDCYGTRT